MIVAIDPGVTRSAYAAFDERGRLLSVAFAAPPCEGVDLVVVERPGYHGARSNAARTQDLIALAWEGAAAAYRFGAPVIELSASGWNHSLPKPVVHSRMWKVLTDAERETLGGDATAARIERAVTKGAAKRWATGGKGGHWYPASFAGHNLLDAAAIGCVYLGRVKL